MRFAGIVRSKKGKGGGYMLARDANEISVGNCIRVLDGPLAPIACASHTAYQPCLDCPDIPGCTVRMLMRRVRDLSSELLDNTSVEEMRRAGGEAPALHYSI